MFAWPFSALGGCVCVAGGLAFFLPSCCRVTIGNWCCVEKVISLRVQAGGLPQRQGLDLDSSVCCKFWVINYRETVLNEYELWDILTWEEVDSVGATPHKPVFDEMRVHGIYESSRPDRLKMEDDFNSTSLHVSGRTKIE